MTLFENTETKPLHDRRRFLKTSVSAATASMIANPSFGQQPAKRRIRKAVKFQMVTEQLSIADKFKLLKDLGFDGTEIQNNGSVDQQEILAASEASGLQVHGVINAANPKLREAIDQARYLGGDSVLVVAGESKSLSFEQNVQHWQKLIRPVLSHAKSSGVRLLIENVRATFLKTAEDMARFIDSFQSSFVASYFDTGNAITWTDQTAQHWVDVLGKRVVKLDIKDRGHEEFGDAKLRSKTAVGTDGGEVHWQNVRAHLAKLNFDGWATAEVKGGDRKRLKGIADWMDQVLGN